MDVKLLGRKIFVSKCAAVIIAAFALQALGMCGYVMAAAGSAERADGGSGSAVIVRSAAGSKGAGQDEAGGGNAAALGTGGRTGTPGVEYASEDGAESNADGAEAIGGGGRGSASGGAGFRLPGEEPGEENAENGSGGDAAARPAGEVVNVYVTGAVQSPGVYKIPAGSMVIDAVRAAGGLTAEADEENINMVYSINEDAMLTIKRVDGKGPSAPGGAESLPGGGDAQKSAKAVGEPYGSGLLVSRGDFGALTGATEAPALPDVAAAGASEPRRALVNINTAGEAEFRTLPGVGESTAKKIIAYRDKAGGFKKIEDIMKVSGIKQAKFSSLKDYITV